MGACGSAVCTAKKISTQGPNTIRVKNRPTKHDLSSSMDNYDAKCDGCDLLAGRVDQQDAQIGVYFIKQELLDKVAKRVRNNAVKLSRLEKWKYMITYGLDEDIAANVFLK